MRGEKKKEGEGKGIRTFRKGRPRFVVFIMCEEEAWGEASSCMVKMRGEGGEDVGGGGGAV